MATAGPRRATRRGLPPQPAAVSVRGQKAPIVHGFPLTGQFGGNACPLNGEGFGSMGGFDAVTKRATGDYCL
jgi:hypothetical protein